MNRETRALFATLAATVFIVAWFGARNLDVPGLYYDEVIQAEPAVQFLAPQGRHSEIPGIRSIRLFGGWFPVMTQTYMGALKSQLLIPVFALVEPTAASLRLTTLAVSLIGLSCLVFWARSALGVAPALLAALLLASDPSFVFVSRHDWGSFSLGFACRCGGLYLFASGWRSRGYGRLAAAGLLWGLGVYNKIDFGAFLVAAATAWILITPSAIQQAIGEWKRLASAAIGLVVGAAPMLAVVGGALAATRYVFRDTEAGFDWSEKLRAGAAVLDGSYFHRLMLAGGSFENMFSVEGAAAGPFLVAFVACSFALAIALRRRRPLAAADRINAFVLLTAWLSLIAIFVTPRAERIHHFLNIYPFPHLVVAVAVCRMWKLKWRGLPLRPVVAVAFAAVVLGNLFVDVRTVATLNETGGKGRWASALAVYAHELVHTHPDAAIVSMDWGFHGPLRFGARELQLSEPIWSLGRRPTRNAVWRTAGSPNNRYLVFEPEYAVFPYGVAFLTAAGELPPNDVEVRRHLDLSGDVAFLSIRIKRPHEIAYRNGFEIRLQ